MEGVWSGHYMGGVGYQKPEVLGRLPTWLAIRGTRHIGTGISTH